MIAEKKEEKENRRKSIRQSLCADDMPDKRVFSIFDLVLPHRIEEEDSMPGLDDVKIVPSEEQVKI